MEDCSGIGVKGQTLTNFVEEYLEYDTVFNVYVFKLCILQQERGILDVEKKDRTVALRNKRNRICWKKN